MYPYVYLIIDIGTYQINMKELQLRGCNIMIQYHNDLNLVAFKDFGARELNIFFSICALMKNKSIDEIHIPFDEIKQITNTFFRNETEFVKYLRSTNRKFLKLTCGYKLENGNLVDFVLFPTFEIDVNEKSLKIEVNKRFSYILNELTKNFTIFELQEFNALSSSYLKNMFRLLKQYKSTGYLKISVEEFRRLLDIPDSYDMRKIGERILKPINKELPLYFDNLHINKIKEGRSIKYFEFMFTPQRQHNKDENQNSEVTTIDVESSVNDNSKDDKIVETLPCPVCGDELIEITSKSGITFWGHKNYRDNPCKHTYSTKEEVETALENKYQNFLKEEEEKKQMEEAIKAKKYSEALVKEIKQFCNDNSQYFYYCGYNSHKDEVSIEFKPACTVYIYKLDNQLISKLHDEIIKYYKVDKEN